MKQWQRWLLGCVAFVAASPMILWIVVYEVGLRRVPKLPDRDVAPLPPLVEVMARAQTRQLPGRWQKAAPSDVYGVFLWLWRDVTDSGVRARPSEPTHELAMVVAHDNEILGNAHLERTALEWWLRRHLTQRQALSMWARRTSFRVGAGGIEHASWHWFGKPISRLTLAESAALFALSANRLRHPASELDRWRQQRDRLLEEAVSQGLVSPVDARFARAQPLLLATSAVPGRSVPNSTD